jgi:hypothetical protein
MKLTLYDYPRSGHAHRIRLFLSIIGEPYESVNVDMQKGEHKDPEYRKLSPLGQVPTLVDGDFVMTDSTAALVYLAIKHGDERWLPRDAEGAARVQRWLSTASGEVYRGPVLARAGRAFGRPVDLEMQTAFQMDGAGTRRSNLARRGSCNDCRHCDVHLYTGSRRGRYKSRTVPGDTSLARGSGKAGGLRSHAARLARRAKIEKKRMQPNPILPHQRSMQN